MLKSLKQIQKIIEVEEKLLLEHTQVALSPLQNIARNLLLKRVETQHQVSYICTFTYMVMMENLLLMSMHKLFMKDMKKYCVKKIEFQSNIDKREAYYQAAGGEKKRRIYGLGSEAKSY